jgi:transcriptional regulator with XRE-family HTH domain
MAPKWPRLALYDPPHERHHAHKGKSMFPGQRVDLRMIRERRLLTQAELAERAGIAPRTIKRLEAGLSRVPHPDTLRRLAAALGVDAADLARLRRGLSIWIPSPVAGALPPLRMWNEWSEILMPRFFRLQVEEGALTDALYAFVIHPDPSRNQLPVIQELHDFAPEMVPVLENMVIDGVDERRYVADYVSAVVGETLSHEQDS